MHCLINRLKKVSNWEWRYSFGYTTVMLLLCGMAIAVSGMLHQAVWLLREPMLENYGVSDSTRVSMNLKDMAVLLRFYEKEHGRPALSIKEVVRAHDLEKLMRPILSKGDDVVYYPLPAEAKDNNGGLLLYLHTVSPAYDELWICVMSDGSPRLIGDREELSKLQLATEKFLSQAQVSLDEAPKDKEGGPE